MTLPRSYFTVRGMEYTAPTLTPEIAEATKSAHADRIVKEVVHKALDIHVLVKVPSRPQYRIFRGMQADKDRQLDAPQMLVDTCVVWPEKAELAKMLDAYPALVDIFAGEIVEAAGVTKDVEQKKL